MTLTWDEIKANAVRFSKKWEGVASEKSMAQSFGDLFKERLPLGFLGPDVIAGNSGMVIPGATLYHFGVLSSIVHMTWVGTVCGRLESRYRYSNDIVYNNFPWP